MLSRSASSPIIADEADVATETFEGCDYQTCGCIKRITKALEFYTTLDIKHHFSVLQYFDEYQSLLDDYHHIMYIHLNTQPVLETREEFEKIHKLMSQSLKPCSVDKCEKIQRNNRNREKQAISNAHDEEEEIKINFYVETMDTIHCFFLHSFDLGFRVKNKDLSTNPYVDHTLKEIDKKGGNGDECEIPDEANDDKQMKALTKTLRRNKDKLRNIKGSDRVQHSKFVSEMTEESKQTDETDADEQDEEAKPEQDENTETKNDQHQDQSPEQTKDEEKKDKQEVEVPRMTSLNEMDLPTDVYSFGRRYYYWPYYKDNETKEADGPNHGYACKYWYIERKYQDIKDEILNNKACALPVDIYNAALFKATAKLQTKLARNIVADGINNNHWNNDEEEKQYIAESLCAEYGIEKGSDMRTEHVLAVVLYCDFDTLSYEFSKTFRKLNKKERNRSMKQRNREFWHWSKALRECIECYGTTVHHSNVKIYYHGVSYLVFNSFISYFASPTSTTASLEVAATFANNNGIILELENEVGYLRHFNCTWISCFASEDERLFVGGYAPLKFRSIRVMETNQNFRWYLKALSLFNLAITGDFVAVEDQKYVNKTDYRIIKALCKQILCDESPNEQQKSRIPEYISALFRQFANSRSVITIHVDNLLRDYVGFKDLLLKTVEVGFGNQFRKNKKTKSNILVNVTSICRIFANCRRIVVDYEDSTKRNLQSAYFVELLKDLRTLESQNESQQYKVTQIKICNARWLKGKFTDAFRKSLAFIEDYKTIGWQFSVQANGNELILYRV